MTSPASGSPTPSFSILMPAYNPGGYLAEALRSALGQMAPGDELLVQDAMSDDGSGEVFDSTAAIDPRLSVVHEPDDGQSDALNRALARATGTHTLWLNADDVIVDGGLDAIRAALRSDPTADLIVGAHQILRADGSVVDTFAGHELTDGRMVRWGCAAFSGSIAMRTGLLRQIGGFETDLHTVMDLSLQFRLADAAPRQHVIDAPVGALRFHEASKSGTQWPTFVRESHRVRMAHAHSLPLKARASVATAYHAAMGVTFRVQLSPAYRRIRRRVKPSS